MRTLSVYGRKPMFGACALLAAGLAAATADAQEYRDPGTSIYEEYFEMRRRYVEAGVDFSSGTQDTPTTSAPPSTSEPPPASEPANAPPTIAGTPAAEVMAGETYTFAPVASDPDGDSLTFSVANAPEWATFDAETGRLHGKPGSGDVGTHSSIRISVSDGQRTTTLAPFSIAVVATAAGAVTLSWVPPAENSDGSPLLDLAGYTVYWGKRSGAYAHSVDIAAGVTRYVIERLTPGTWYFATRAFNSDGAYSEYSNEASKTLE